MATRERQREAAPPVSRNDGIWAVWSDLPHPQRSRIVGFASYVALLTLLFIQPLAGLVRHAAHYELHSHILLVPFITGYLLYIRRGLPPVAFHASIPGTVIMSGIGFIAVTAGIQWRNALSTNDSLALFTFAFVSLVSGGGFLFLGSRWMAAQAFPVSFLIFMIPLPDALVNWLEGASVLASAEATAMYFGIVGTPLVRQGTIFELPGITLEVAQQCSGIRSSWVLFITSLLASNVFLKTTWRRVMLVAFVIPLGILRNGFRILVIGLLCVHVGPHMVHSPIHHRGGPIFFALSLLPLALLLWWFRRREQRLKPPVEDS